MDNEVFDCAIVGGGLGGLTLAIQLADSGYSVILFEKEKYPFHKVCGEYISMESYNFLERIGLPLSEIDPPIITEVLISAPNGNSITRKLGLGGFGISRYTLDATLAALAQKKGVVLVQGTKVNDITYDRGRFTVNAGAREYQAKVTCCAYGKRSLLDNKLKRENKRERKNYMAAKYHVKLDLPGNRIELHNFKDGYCGISKVDGDKYCLCYLTNAKNLGDNYNDIGQMEQNVVMKNPFLKKYFSEAVFLNKTPFTISQVTFSKKTAIEDNMLMIGDAAGNIAPLCGNGMSMAMHASFLAFQLVKKHLDKEISFEEMLQLYERQWNDVFSGRINSGRRLQYLFGKETLTNVTIGMLRRMPAFTDRFISRTHGVQF